MATGRARWPWSAGPSGRTGAASSTPRSWKPPAPTRCWCCRRRRRSRTRAGPSRPPAATSTSSVPMSRPSWCSGGERRRTTPTPPSSGGRGSSTSAAARRCTSGPSSRAPGCGRRWSRCGTTAPSWPPPRPAPWCCATRWSIPGAGPTPSASGCSPTCRSFPTTTRRRPTCGSGRSSCGPTVRCWSGSTSRPPSCATRTAAGGWRARARSRSTARPATKSPSTPPTPPSRAFPRGRPPQLTLLVMLKM
ncbi:MAG: hypothetical protein QOF96_337 [Actinomycetota bacterium]|nr:hypothetical protein [Actinomycetota bacterium]